TNVGSYRLSNPVGAVINPGVEIPIGTIVFETDPMAIITITPEDIIAKNSFAEHNKNTLKDIQYKIKNIMSSSLANVSSNKYAAVSIRIYTLNNVYNGNLRQVAAFVAEYLRNPVPYEDSEPLMMLDKNRIIGGDTDDQYLPFTHRLVEVVHKPNTITDISFPAVRTPSAKAIELAKQVASRQNSFLGDLFSPTDLDEQTDVKSKALKNALVSCIVDVWVEYINPDSAGVETKMPFTTDNMNEKQKSTVKNEIDPSGVDEFYNNIKETSQGYEVTANGVTQTISITLDTSKLTESQPEDEDGF
ncbi:MAG: hypothetical protein PHP35_02440, partial [Candidatus Colwellbacteria bacterium]|nr:hypothetical protein [Candidatus Colwellbacteria bacterium]